MHIPLLLLAASLRALAQSTQDATAVSAEYTDDDAFRKAALEATNRFRGEHDAAPLSWNESLAEFAAEWSRGCEFEHSGGPSGENLAAGYPNTTAAIDAWGNERSAYDFDDGDFDDATGHFTQLVWRNTTTVGCARTECNGEGDGGAPGWYVVCEYFPAGNVLGQFKDNVLSRVATDDAPQGAGGRVKAGVRAIGVGVAVGITLAAVL